MKIESEDIDIGSLLSGRYLHIPRFQRPFSWEMEHVNQFWTDLIENQGDEYFIGSMVLYRKGKQDFGIVDGQQRLTTITILLCVIRDFYIELNQTDLALGLHNLIENKNIENKDTFVLKTESSFPYFQDEIQSYGEAALNLLPGPEEVSLKKAYDQLMLLLDDVIRKIDTDIGIMDEEKVTQKVSRLSKIRDTVLALKVIKVTLENEEEAYLIFETLNSRGKDLELSDLVKNHFSKLIGKKNDVDIVKEKWSSVLEVFQASQADISPNTFITHYWASRYDSIPQRRIFPILKKAVVKENAAKYLNSLVSDSLLYRRIYEPTYGWDKNERAVQESLTAIQLFRLSQPTPALLSLVRAFQEEKIKVKLLLRALRAIENFHFAFTAVTSSRSSGGISFMYSAFAQRLFSSTTTQGASDEIDNLIGKLRERRPVFNEFLVGFEQILFTNSLTKQKALVRYILIKVAKHYNYVFPVDWDELTIEHIYPQEKINESDWPEEIVGQIGNLILVSHSLNQKLSTKNFGQKKTILAKSDESYSTFVNDQDLWNADKVAAHTEQLADLAYHNVWKV
jgi:flagellin-specific chaperone FliS